MTKFGGQTVLYLEKSSEMDRKGESEISKPGIRMEMRTDMLGSRVREKSCLKSETLSRNVPSSSLRKRKMNIRDCLF